MKKNIILSLLIVLFVSGCNSNKQEKFSDSFFSFDTYIQLDGYTKNQEEFTKYYELAKADFEKYHELFDAYNNYSGVNNLKLVNDNAGKKAVEVSPELYEVIKQSIEYYNNTYKKNNITLAPVTLLYKDIINEYNEGKKVSNPSDTKLKEKAKCVGMENIELQENNKIYLKKACSKIDVGSVAKGYVSNKVANKLEKAGLKSGILNAGGNVAVIGKKEGNKDFNIGIANPDDPNTNILTVKTNNTNIVTSGDYQRYYIVNGVKYNHITDPDTLKSADKNKSVTVISKYGLIADYFSTECFMLELDKVKELSKKYKFEYIIIDKTNKITISDGLKDAVEIK